MYSVNLMGLMSGISNVAVNSVLGRQGMEFVSSFFEGYQNGLYLTSILYLTVAVQVCALSVPVQAAYASTFMGMSAVNVAMSTVMFVASVMEHNDREILLYGTLLIVSLFEFSSAHNMYCEVTVQGGKGSNTLVYDGSRSDSVLTDTNKNVVLNALKEAPVEYSENPRTGIMEPYMKQAQINDEYEILLRRDIGDFNHGDLDHWNLEVQTVKGKKTKYNIHLYFGEDGNLLPYTENEIYIPKKSPFK